MISKYEVAAALSVTLGFVFLASSIPKLRSPRAFVLLVLQYRVLPPRLGRPVGYLVPPLELAIALLMLGGVTVKLAALAVSLILLSFLAAVSINIARGRDVECGCFGAPGSRRVGPKLVIQDCALLFMAAGLFPLAAKWSEPEPWSVLRMWPWVARFPFGPGLACGAAMLAVLALARPVRRGGAMSG